ncbi:hypothetical protein QBC43DRAFT_131876 [Cladorrhinum sp. PSN259]|nr:hypothetical protein QBC43DRAFT_131876 [Cladorrhinum sp. PSN259]
MSDQGPGIILVLGVTGAGKSYFINQLRKRPGTRTIAEGQSEVREGDNLNSETVRCQAVEIIRDDDDDPRNFTIVDTPGFDDTSRPDGEVFAEISDHLATQYASGYPLKGVLYLHKITDNKMTGSSGRYLSILEEIIGTDALKKTILVTTMWYMLRDEFYGEGLNRQQQLIDEFWRPLMDKGAEVRRFDGSPASASQIVSRLIGDDSEPVVLDHQREIIDQGRTLEATSAGRTLLQQLESTKVEYTVKLANLERELEYEIDQNNRAGAREKEKQMDQVREMLKRVDRSLAKLKTQPGLRIKERIGEVMTGANATRAVHVLSAILNITWFIVQVVVGG